MVARRPAVREVSSEELATLTKDPTAVTFVMFGVPTPTVRPHSIYLAMCDGSCVMSEWLF